MKGQVKNYSSRTLWVLVSKEKKMNAYQLAPGRCSPENIDADGFKAVEDIPIDGYRGWIKIVDICTAEVKEEGNKLTSECLFCGNVDDEEFGEVSFYKGDDWGEVIAEN